MSSQKEALSTKIQPSRDVFDNIIIGHFRVNDNQKVYHLEHMILYARIVN